MPDKQLGKVFLCLFCTESSSYYGRDSMVEQGSSHHGGEDAEYGRPALGVVSPTRNISISHLADLV